MKKIVFIGFLLIFINSCSQKEQPKEQSKRLSPRIEREIVNYIKENDYENDSSKIIMVYINSLFNETNIVITSSMTRMYRDEEWYYTFPNNFYELQNRAILIYDKINRVYDEDSIRQKNFERFIEKYDKYLIDAALFNPDIWMIKIKQDSFNIIKLPGVLEEYANEIRWFSPVGPPPPVMPQIQFVSPKKKK